MNNYSSAAARYHVEMLLLAIIVVGAACLLEVRADQKVAVKSLPALVIPPTCMSNEAFGVPCPGCGLTRSFVELGHGRFGNSLAQHRVGWILAVAVVFQIPYRIIALRRRKNTLFPSRLSKGISGVLIALLIANWLWELACMFV